MPVGMIDYAAELQRQRCKSCWHADGIDFHVPDQVWREVVPACLQNHVVCLRCFDRFAAVNHVNYVHHLGPVHFAGDQQAFELAINRPGLALQISDQVLDDLEALVQTGYFGANAADAASQVLREALCRIKSEKTTP